MLEAGAFWKIFFLVSISEIIALFRNDSLFRKQGCQHEIKVVKQFSIAFILYRLAIIKMVVE